mmetsp:Transcript_6481/g.10618  ORF Transcript_6481/g.10618 Transcript_6481/m.10618 type:complete len:360 (+) Transcript_6481:49-1128(+)
MEIGGSKRPQNTAFKQQQLKAWQPILTPKWVISTFFVVGIIFIPVGIVVLKASQQVLEYSASYSGPATGIPIAMQRVPIFVSQRMEPPIYFYYQLENFYQNHRRYVKSRSDTQLRGESVVTSGALEDCQPRVLNPSFKNYSCSPDFPWGCLNPAGLIAWSKFNDTFVLVNATTDSAIPWDKNGIAWKSDAETKFKNRPECVEYFQYSEQGNLTGLVAELQARQFKCLFNNCSMEVDYRANNCVNVTDEDFIVWMRTAGLPTFRKLHRIIRQPLEAGQYVLLINATFPVEQFDGKKAVVLSTTTWIGGRNDFLGLAYLIVGTLCIVLGAGFLVKHLHSPRKPGDAKYLIWNRGSGTDHQG